MKNKIYIIAFIAIITTIIQSCTEEDNTSTCTIYLNGEVWSEQTVSDCSICTAPRGYTKSCN
jgi:hypothetical protein